MKVSRTLLATFASFLATGFLFAQSDPIQTGAGCSIAEPPLRLAKPNIFNDQQEQWLGDIMAEQQEPSYDLLPEKDSAELNRIGQKLLAQLPPTPIVFHFQVYESIQANGFSLAGGYVYVSRKLITDARSEDEVAAVMAHEIGHIYTRQISTALTRELKKLLSVTALTTRDDITNNMQLLENAPWKDSAGQSEDEEEKDELLADRVGLYALIRAGYAPRALSENLDRITANKGRTGNFLTDVLGGTSEISRRVRVTRKLAASLPGACRERTPGTSESFKAFQQALLDVPVHPLIDATPNLNAFKLEPPISGNLRQVRYSPDGKWILAQDDSAAHVLSLNPLKYKFSVEARGADLAHFSPDSAHLLFEYPSMRVEKWNVATGKRHDFHEVIDYEGCEQTSLTPDGRTIVCMAKTESGTKLKLIDVDTNKTLVDNKGFFVGGVFGMGMIVRQGGGARIGSVAYSQDEKTMLIAIGGRAVAYDVAGRNTISLNKDLSKLVDGRLVFVDSKNLLYDCDFDYKAGTSRDTFQVCESTFPDGMPLSAFKIGYQWIEPVTNGARVLIGPTKSAAAMLVDPATGKASAAFKMDSVDMYGTSIASENEGGGVSVNQLAGGQSESANLPAEPLYGMEAVAFSPDGHYLAYSSKTRSAIWDLTAKKRVSLMRPFRVAWFDSQNVMLAQYQPANQQAGANYQIDMKTGHAAEVAKFVIEQFQHEDVLVNYEPLDKSGSTLQNVNVHVADATTGKELWMRHYGHEAPSVESVRDNTLILAFDVSGESGTNLLRHAGDKLVKSSDFRSQWAPRGWLVELVDSKTGTTQRVLELPYLANSNADPRWARVFGDTLVVHGSGNTSGIYRVTDGVRLGGFYGRVLTGEPKLGLLAISNHDQEVTILDMATGKRLKSVTLDQIPEAAQFIADKNQLLILSANQTVTTIPVQKP